MTTAQTDPVRAATPDDRQDRVEARASGWYDPDSAAFDLDDPLADLEPADEDTFAAVERA
jgi:hypothetical protein